MRSLALACIVLAACGGTSPPPPVAPMADTGTAEAHDDAAEALVAAGDLDGAEREFRLAIAASPDFGFAHDGLAVVHFHRGDVPSGIAALEAGIAVTPAVDPTYARTRLLENLAWIHMMAGREREAFAALDGSVAAQALDAATAAAVTHLGRARLLLRVGRAPEALTAAAAVRSGTAPPFARDSAGAVEVLALAATEPPAAAALRSLTEELGPDHPRLGEPAVAVAIATGELATAAAALAKLEAADAVAAEPLARAERAAGREDDARARVARLATQYLRSAPSAHVPRLAAGQQQATRSD